jgi:hypothetical protein
MLLSDSAGWRAKLGTLVWENTLHDLSMTEDVAE